ncbi:MAG: HypC/HybG/HupF family hydrogenase formation chaperone, partial [Klebsiella pneumoniae]|nr:HypC/HybG/HupF family hydrogenase formation chaperone [Klebsiella pneumoniae]
EKLVASRSAYIDRIHTSYDNVLGKNKVDVIKGFARFVDAHTVEVNGEIITADHILIATGGRPSHPDIPGVEYGIDSDGFFELPALPKRVAVVGAGYIAVELAGVINGLGAETHLFVRKHAPLRSFDPLIVETLVEVMNAEGPQLHTNAIPKAVVKNADGSLTLVGAVDEQGQPRLGQWVLVHVGFAMSVINEAEARDTLEALQNMFDVEPDVGALLYGEER